MGSTAPSPLRQLRRLGQSVWLDFISRDMLVSGGLEALRDESGISGVTSNPAIFEIAISRGRDYTSTIRKLAGEGYGSDEIYGALVTEDVQRAADILRPVYERESGRDGFVSVEVSPHLAKDAAGTIAEAKRLSRRIDRPNVMIKVPATPAGLSALRVLIRDGVNVNMTLLFSPGRYRDVFDAYMLGLEDALAAHQDLGRRASVASFFLSRIDTAVDEVLSKRATEEGADASAYENLKGSAAIASARQAYAVFTSMRRSRRFQRLLRNGAQHQRLLWASTGTKNPQYSDVMYVEPLIGPYTVTTLPPETLRAFREHGIAESTLFNEGADPALQLLALQDANVELETIAARLLEEGIQKFVDPFDRLMQWLDRQASGGVIPAARP